jgi:hypothetical protein
MRRDSGALECGGLPPLSEAQAIRSTTQKGWQDTALQSASRGDLPLFNCYGAAMPRMKAW